MKSKIILLTALLFTTLTNAQVGINTDTPRGALDVNGDMVSTQLIFPKNLEAVDESIKNEYNLLVQNTVTNNIELLDVRTTDNTGIAALVTFELVNPQGDWIESFNTKIDATKYALVVLSGYFSHNVTGSNNSSALPGVGAKVVNNQWVLNADYPALNLDSSIKDGSQKWIITCSIFPKTYVKIFPEQTVNMNNNDTNTNSAGSPILK
ncbi:hypothetical protein [Empedobacter tilapiae]|uniref:hypothetical protein n=1 Tax=Empedobacter tilapiae TaxID=2491114 RepID=UPI0028D65E88|nr:hypothetical protein [Empedobacter tilapiae]